MNDWLTVIIVVFIIAVVLDGIRRARNNRRSQVRLSKNARKADKLFDTEITSSKTTNRDFPSGGARVKDEAQVKPDVRGSSKSDTPQQASLNLDDPVPMLMDSVEEESQEHELQEADVDTHLEPSIGDIDELESVLNESDVDEVVSSPLSDDDAKDWKTETKSTLQKAADYFTRDSQAAEGEGSELAGGKAQDSGVEQEPEEIIVVNVMAKSGCVFLGEALFEVLTETKLKFGQMGIFHRHVNDDGDADSVFSVANIIEPGVFDLSTIKTIETPGLCMFLPLPSALPAVEAYENLIDTAKYIAHHLDGEVKDENRSALTNQTIEHGRQRVLEFERKHQLHK